MLEKFLNKPITVLCRQYFYSGVLCSYDDYHLELDDVDVVFETGKFGDKEWKTSERLPGKWYVERSNVEAFGNLKDPVILD